MHCISSVNLVVRNITPNLAWDRAMRFDTFLRSGICATVLFAIVPAVAFADPLTVTVDDLDHDGQFSNAQVYNGFGCRGDNVSPRVSWAHVPPGTRSIVVTMYDPDAPTGGLGWTHWEVVNIPPSETSIRKGASGDARRMPVGALETLTDFGESRYGGPCPPQGESHRYVVTVSALSIARVDLKSTSSPAVVAYQMHGNILEQARYVATYHRSSN